MSDLPRSPQKTGSFSLAKIVLTLITALLGLLGLDRFYQTPVPGPASGEAAAVAAPLAMVMGTDTVFHRVAGPWNGTASPGTNFLDTITIAVQPGRIYQLRVRNGTSGGANRVTSAVTRWNGFTVIGTTDLTAATFQVVKVLAATKTDTLKMTVVGAAGSFVNIAVLSLTSDQFNIFGENTCNITSGTTRTCTPSFTKPVTAAPVYRMLVTNGDTLGANRVTSGQIKLNGTTIFATTELTSATGTLSKNVTVPAGSNALNIVVNGSVGKFIKLRITATDTTTPAMTVTAPVESTTTNLGTIPVTGTLVDQTTLGVTVNGIAATVTNNTSFAGSATLVEGWNNVVVTATDAIPKFATVTRHIRRDTQAPALTITAPLDSTYTKLATVAVTGTVTDATPTTVTCNATGLTVSAGSISGNCPVVYGPNTLTFTATDLANNATSIPRLVVRDTLAPTLTVSAPLNGDSTSADSIFVTGTVADANPGVAVAANGVNLPVTAGAFSKKIVLGFGVNAISIVATDRATNATTVVRTVTKNIPGDPSLVAPALPKTVATTIGASTSFLYTGPNPTQTGVAAGTIKPTQVAVLRGKVLDSVGTALPGVAITILGHPEFGATVSRLDGMFDIAVNGGSRLTVSYAKAGLLTGQRSLQVPWQDYVTVDSVALVSIGRIVDTVRFNQPMQVVRADSVTDASGGRRPSLMFRDSTVVTATLPGGGTQVITGPIAIRVQEFTVGTLGVARMPAQLPPTSAYTYAVALNVDSALALGSTSVSFSKPVAFYVDNFLGFPVGAAVPVGAYDPQQGAWVSQADGVVLKILGVTGGLATLAVDSTGGIATPAQLTALGIDSLEQVKLASTYPVNKTLWRVSTQHFSWYDFNWGLTIDYFFGPNGGAPRNRSAVPSCPQEGNSTIGCETQTLGEALPLVGTPFSLHYQSDRVPGFGAAFGVDIPLRGDTIPPSVSGIYVEMTIAGRHIDSGYVKTQTRAKFLWDGKDIYGRYVQGPQKYKIGVGWVYDTRYMGANSGGGGGGGGFGGYLPLALAIDGRTKPVILVQWDGVLGPWNALPLGLGGWTLSAHHAYDPNSRTLHLGDGGHRETVSIGNTLEQVAGTGTLGFSGDGGPAIVAKLKQPLDVAVAPDGSIYITDGNQRIRKVAPDGIITTVAGTGVQGYSGDNGPATSAQLNNPDGIALGPDGSLYIADRGNSRIRKVSPTGTITTVAGNGTVAYSGDGGLATAASLSAPGDLAVASDGSLYIADEGNIRIRRVTTNGYITTVAGTGVNGISGNGGPATLARLSNIASVAVGPDGAFYIPSSSGYIRRVGTDGIITHFAGTDPNTALSFPDDGKLATITDLRFPNNVVVGPDGTVYIAEEGASINKKRGLRIDRVIASTGILSTIAGNGTQQCGNSAPSGCHQGDDGDRGLAPLGYLYAPLGMALAPNGDLIFADREGNQIRRVTTAQPGLPIGNMLIASEDGSEVYEFDASGRHLKTRDALTGAAVLTFGYDTLGLIAAINDSNGNVTTIQRNAQGKATSITAPFGQVTSLTTDPTSGFLTSLANPGGERFNLWYKANGLLDSLADPKNNHRRFTYDSIGQLVKDEGPAGGFISLARTPFISSKTSADTGWKVTTTSALGRTKSYAYEFLPNGQTLRTFTDGAGKKTTSNVEAGITTYPDSTVATTSLAGDPRFGMQAPTLFYMNMKLPSGLTAFAAGRRHDSLSVATDPLSLFSQTDSIQLGTSNNWTISTYTASTRRTVATSPLGRQSFSTLDAQGRVVSAQVAGLDSVRFKYDSRGRLDSVVDGGRKTKYSYSPTSGRLTSVTDPLARITQFAYDSAGRVTTQTLPDGRVILFSYDSSGNLTSLTPPGRPAHGFQYTSVDLARQYDPPGIPGAKPTKYFYNLDKQVDSIVRPDSIAVKFTYDGAGRPSSVLFDRGTQSFGYSGTSGSLTSLRTPTGDSLKVRYDGSLPTAVVWKGTLNDSVTVTYDSAFRVQTQAVHGGTPVAFGYDKDGLLTSAGALRLGRSLTNGLLLADTLNRVRSAYSYTTRGELKGYRVERAGTLFFGAGYVRDSLGRITARTDTVNGTITPWSFVYDSVGRLKSTTQGATTRAYEYDLNGNRSKYTVTGSGAVVPTYDNQDRLLTYGNITCTYGSNGELKTRQVGAATPSKYTYDALGNLMKVVLPSGTDSIEYLIDGQNRRVGRKLNGVVTRRWLYQNQLNPVGELDGAGNLTRFVYGSRANVPDYLLKGGNVYRLISDHLGSVRLVVDTATGTIAQRIDYDEFGVATVVSGAGFQPFGFAGGLTDSATTLVRFGARDYDPQVGRWTAKDPIGFEGGSGSLYSYAAQDPVNNRDPNGMFWETAWDAFSFASSLKDFICNPGWGTGFWATADGISLLVPFLPAIGMVRHGDDVVSIARRMSPDQEALKEIVEEASRGGRNPLSVADAEAILDWAEEVNYPGARALPGDLANPSNWTANPVPHIHIPGAGRGSSGHVPVSPGVTPRP